MNPTPQSTPVEIDVHAVQQLRSSDEDFLLLDCREIEEWQTVKLDGATLIPMGSMPARIGELEPYRDKRIVVYCHHGGRSLQVTRWLRQQGFDQAQNMRGGIDAWSLKIDPSLPRYR